MIDYNLLNRLCSENGVSGDEENIRSIILDEIKDYIDEYKVDSMGNLIVFKKGTNKAAKKLLLSAHMDEVGFIIKHITDDGFLKFSAVGGIEKSVLCGRNVIIGKNKINGVIASKPIHLLKPKEREKALDIDDLYIDIGANCKEEAQNYVSLGDFACFKSTFDMSSKSVKSKAIDDRIGCTVLIDMIKSNLPYDMYFSFVVQEEVGLRGSTTAAYYVNPDAAIVVEATTAADIPQSKNEVCLLGKGAVVSFMDRGTIYDKEYFNLVLDISKAINTKVQVKRAVAGGNDSAAIQKSRNGVRTIALSLPCRYIHSEMAVAFKEDIEALSKIVLETATRIAQG